MVSIDVPGFSIDDMLFLSEIDSSCAVTSSYHNKNYDDNQNHCDNQDDNNHNHWYVNSSEAFMWHGCYCSFSVDPCAPPVSNYVAVFSTSSRNYTFYSYIVTAQSTGYTDLEFNFRSDLNASWHLDDVSLKGINGSNLTEVLVNGDFETHPLGWTGGCWQQCAVGTYGSVGSLNCHSGHLCYFGGCQGAFDSLIQSVLLTAHVAYNLSFWLYLDMGGGATPQGYVSLN